jgi:hypothetical protein
MIMTMMMMMVIKEDQERPSRSVGRTSVKLQKQNARLKRAWNKLHGTTEIYFGNQDIEYESSWAIWNHNVRLAVQNAKRISRNTKRVLPKPCSLFRQRKSFALCKRVCPTFNVRNEPLLHFSSLSTTSYLIAFDVPNESTEAVERKQKWTDQRNREEHTKIEVRHTDPQEEWDWNSIY